MKWWKENWWEWHEARSRMGEREKTVWMDGLMNGETEDIMAPLALEGQHDVTLKPQLPFFLCPFCRLGRKKTSELRVSLFYWLHSREGTQSLSGKRERKQRERGNRTLRCRSRRTGCVYAILIFFFFPLLHLHALFFLPSAPDWKAAGKRWWWWLWWWWQQPVTARKSHCCHCCDTVAEPYIRLLIKSRPPQLPQRKTGRGRAWTSPCQALR